MYGLIGRMIAQPGRRDELIELLVRGVENGMPGCLSYVVARDPADADSIWVSEVWDTAESHRGSLALPQVQDAIRLARPLIASFAEHHEIEPVGGIGITKGREA